jgi:DNA-binding transcriptional LysR family regulator
MNIKQLRYVVAIANTGTFREASEQLYVSQPSMSIAVKDLETELGLRFLSAFNTGVSLTISGERFTSKLRVFYAILTLLRLSI